MSSITKRWTEADFRRELKKIDEHVKRTQGIELDGAKRKISYFERSKRIYGQYHCGERSFKFSLPFFNSDVPEACAVDVIRHEYAHFYAHVVLGYRGGHGKTFKQVCHIVGADPSTYYTQAFEASARRQEEQKNMVFHSSVKIGQAVLHPTFGEGRVCAVLGHRTTALLTVDFAEHGKKVIEEAWLRANGVI